ncbi:hypothetical protein B0H14DRAFT_3504243 [Mycena olivaceomarginata]|nr:hypothetical protein B0H14DRAFT_3504243 [Mycena olivaceomarginata]
MFAATPLDNTTVTIVLHYISPIIQTLPQHLVASELAFRQSCLKLTPDDPAYLFWPSSDDRRVIDALESLQQKPIDDIPLDFEIRYTADDSLFAHVQLNDLRLVFHWEDESWRYHNLAPMPFLPAHLLPSMTCPKRSFATAIVARTRPIHTGTQRESSGSYWDMYNSVQGSGDSVIPSPVSEKHPRRDPLVVPYSYADMHPATDPIESLSDRLEAISRRTDDDTITVVNGTSLETEPSEVALKESLRPAKSLELGR